MGQSYQQAAACFQSSFASTTKARIGSTKKLISIFLNFIKNENILLCSFLSAKIFIGNEHRWVPIEGTCWIGCCVSVECDGVIFEVIHFYTTGFKINSQPLWKIPTYLIAWPATKIWFLNKTAFNRLEALFNFPIFDQFSFLNMAFSLQNIIRTASEKKNHSTMHYPLRIFRSMFIEDLALLFHPPRTITASPNEIVAW